MNKRPMAYTFKTSVLLYVFTRFLSAFAVAMAIFFIILFAAEEQWRWILFCGLFIIIFGPSAFFLRRVIVRNTGLRVQSVFGSYEIPYGQIVSAWQLFCVRPKTIIVKSRRKFPRKYIFYCTDFFWGDLFNLNIHESVEYINTRAQAANSE